MLSKIKIGGNFMKYTLLLTLLLFLTACSKEDGVPTLVDPTPDQQLSDTLAGLTFSILQDHYADAAPEFKTTLKNQSEISFEYGEYYHIEVWKENQWYIMTHSDSVFLENPKFTNQGKLLPAGDTVEQTFKTEILGVRLVPGEYRLVKIFQKPQAPYYEVTLAIPFTIETGDL